MKKEQLLFKKRVWQIVAAVSLLALLALAYFVWQTRQPAQAKPTSQAKYQTTQVRRGNLALSASGTGTLEPVQQVDLNFPVSGTVAELNVQVGDQVTAGKILAVLAGMDALKVDISSKQVALETAKQALNDLSITASTNLPQALVDLSNAQAALTTAKQNLHQKGDPRCDDSVTRAYELDYYFAMADLNLWQSHLENPNSKYGLAFIQDHIAQYKPRAINDYVNWKYCEGYTDQEILVSQANLQLAEANVQHAQAAYQKMQTNAGLDPTAVAIAQATVKAAELQLQAAQKNLDGATLVAPIDGVVTAVNGNKGELAGTSTFITLADLAYPQIDTTFDETDLQNVAAGCTASVSFNVLPNRTFAGTVTRILPALITSRNVNAVEGYIELKDMTALTGKTLPVGTNAAVDVTCNQVQNALLVPVEALHTTADGQSYVYILNQVGTPEKVSVEVGLKTATTAEIRSGLQDGESVITSTVNLQ